MLELRGKKNFLLELTFLLDFISFFLSLSSTDYFLLTSLSAMAVSSGYFRVTVVYVLSAMLVRLGLNGSMHLRYLFPLSLHPPASLSLPSVVIARFKHSQLFEKPYKCSKYNKSK